MISRDDPGKTGVDRLRFDVCVELRTGEDSPPERLATDLRQRLGEGRPPGAGQTEQGRGEGPGEGRRATRRRGATTSGRARAG